MTSLIGIKIISRNDSFISSSIPTRDQIQKNNYHRRLRQWEGEGLRSKPWKPYVTLGQQINIEEQNENKKDEVEQEVNVDNTCARSKVTIPESYHSRPISSKQRDIMSRQTLSRCSDRSSRMNRSIRDQIKKTELINCNVRSGQSFFNIIDKEEEEKKNQEEKEQIEELSKVKAGKNESDSDSDEDYAPSLATTGLDFNSRPSTGIIRKKLPLRPYTPIYNNLTRLVYTPSNIVPSTTGRSSRPVTRTTEAPSSRVGTAITLNSLSDSDTQGLYRQLCALHWILKCLVLENGDSEASILLSWQKKDSENSYTSHKSRREIKTAWDKYVAKSQTQVKQTKTHMTHTRPPSKQSSPHSSNRKTPDEHSKNNIQLHEENAQGTEVLSQEHNKHIIRKRPISSIEYRRKLVEKVKNIENELNREENEPKNTIRFKKQDKRAEIKRIAAETKLLPEDKCEERFENFVEISRQKSQQIAEERMQELESQIKNMSDYKSYVCSKKFSNFHPKGPFHMMIKEFRGRDTYKQVFNDLEASKNRNIYFDWYTNLQMSVDEITNYYNVQIILSNIRKYALKTITKYSESRLFDLLDTLQSWELCHPDVSAAIFFITTQVIPIDEVTYNTWLQKFMTNKAPNSAAYIY